MIARSLGLMEAHAPLAPEAQWPCRVMETRGCPDPHHGERGPSRPCARFESSDESPGEGE